MRLKANTLTKLAEGPMAVEKTLRSPYELVLFCVIELISIVWSILIIISAHPRVIRSAMNHDLPLRLLRLSEDIAVQ